MPSTAIQSRISAFESIANPSLPPSFPPRAHDSPRSPPYAARKPVPASPSPSPPNLGRKTSLIDLKDWIVDDGPSSPHTNGYKHYSGMTSGDDNGRTPTQQGFETKRKLVAPLINLESPPRPTDHNLPIFSPTIPAKAPPLPPRKPSYASLKSVASVGSSTGQPYRSDSLTVDHTYPPFKLDTDVRSRNNSGHAPASSISSFHSVSLSSDTDPSTPGSASSNFIATFPIDHEREQQHSREVESASLAESYEEVLTPSVAASPATERIISLDWEKATAKRKGVPPRLPQRPSLTSLSSASSVSTALKSPPSKRQSSSSSSPGSPGFRASGSSVSSFSTAASGGQVRRAPPPPPSRTSDRSSIQSLSSTYSHSSQGHGHRPLSSLHLKTKRPTPVPAAARVRYESVFNTNIIQARHAQKAKAKERPTLLSPTEARGASRRAAGWRGLSVDLITGAEDVPTTPNAKEEEEVSTVVESTDCLEGHLVKTIWRRSRLDRRRLGEIWHECDPSGTGSLNRDSFVKGMWRIDEELRRAQTQALKSTSPMSLGSLRGRGALFRPPIPINNKPRPILR